MVTYQPVEVRQNLIHEIPLIFSFEHLNIIGCHHIYSRCNLQLHAFYFKKVWGKKQVKTKGLQILFIHTVISLLHWVYLLASNYSWWRYEDDATTQNCKFLLCLLQVLQERSLLSLFFLLKNKIKCKIQINAI